jgi:uncharacterized RDD family membrane protein YckC
LTSMQQPPSFFFRRALAIIIDIALLASMHQIIFILLGNMVFQALSIDTLASFKVIIPVFFVVFLFSFILLSMFYFIIFHAWLGQTIGKMICGIKVVSEGNNPITMGTAFLRWAGYFLSMLPFASGFLWSVVERDHCAWHDKLALTRVVAVEMT